jgi:DNA-binding response OmpR family regulator
VFSIVIVSNQDEVHRLAATAFATTDYELSSVPHSDSTADELGQNPPYVLIFDHGDGGHIQEWRSIATHEQLRENTALLALFRAEQPQLLDVSPPPEDFVLWPANSVELLLRVRAILRRRANVDAENILRCGDLVIDLANYKVTLEGHPIELTFKEYELLRFLASNRDKVFTREALLNRVWGYDYFGGARTVDVHIRRLRSKIEDRGHAFIETIRNVGYRFHES